MIGKDQRFTNTRCWRRYREGDAVKPGSDINLYNFLWEEFGSMSHWNFTSRKSTHTCAQSCMCVCVCVCVYQIFLKVAKGWRETKIWIGAVLIPVQLFSTPWTVAPQAPLSMKFPMQEYWNGLPFPPLGESFQPRDQTCVSCTGRRISHQYHIFSHGISWN